MSDEAFARRFYSDRAELLALGVPLDSQRDEFTGEELYRLSSERYFLPPLELTDEELAALQTCLYLLEGQFAYAEPLRLALQNLALGRPGLEVRRPRLRGPSSCTTRATRRSFQGGWRSSRARSRRSRTLKFEYWSIMRRSSASARSTHTRSSSTGASGTSSASTSTTTAIKTFRVSRIRGEIRLATRRERDFRLAEGFDAEDYRQGPPWQVGDKKGEAQIEVARRHRLVGRPPVRALWPDRGRRLHHRLLAISGNSPPGSCARTAALCRSRLPSSAGTCARDLDLVHKRHAEKTPRIAAEAAQAVADEEERPGQPRSAGALRPPPGPARVPARPLRRRHARRDPGGGHQRALQHPAGVARGASPAPEPRQLRRRLLRGLHRAPRRPGSRGEGALRRHVPLTAPSDAARGARDPARARVRRPDDRRRRAHAARARPPEARGDLRRVRPRAGGRASFGAGRGEARGDAQRRHPAAPRSSRSSTRRKARTRSRRGSSSRT